MNSLRGNRLLKVFDFYAGAILILVIFVFTRRKIALPGPYKRILIIKLAAVGDTVLLVPLLRSVRRNFPKAFVAVVGTTINREIVSWFPSYVNRFFDFRVRKAAANPLYFARFIRDLRSQDFDLVLDAEQWSFITPIICRLARIPTRVGFRIYRPVRHLLYNRICVRQKDLHESRNFLGLLSAIGIEEDDRRLELPVDAASSRRVQRVLRQSGWKKSRKLVVVHPGCGVHGFPREWPLESYQQLCRRLSASFPLFFVITGSTGEERLKAGIVATVPANSVGWDDPDLASLVALVSTADLLISGNNGIMHIGAALGKRQIVLDGPNDTRKWGPLNRRATIIRSTCPGCPCLDLGFEYHRTDGFCMKQISVEEVFDSASKILKTR